VLIIADDFAQFEKELPLLADGLLEESKIRLSKVGFLKKYKEFAEQYSCLWIPTGVAEKEAALSMSRFPSQLTKNLYLANLTNIMSKECTQLKMLGIENIIAMTPSKVEGMEDYNVLHFEVEKFEKDLQSLLDLDQITEEAK